jgi:hypothetical protein
MLCTLVITPDHILHPQPTLINNRLFCLCAHNCISPFTLYFVSTGFSPPLRFAFLLYCCTAFTLPRYYLLMLATCLIHTISVIFDTTYSPSCACRLTHVMLINLWQLSSDIRVKGCNISTSPHKSL